MRRALLVVLLVLLAAQPAAAEDPAPPPAEPLIAAGVTVAGLAVGGLTADAATSVLTTAFEAPLPLRIGQRVVKPKPATLGATAYIDSAVEKALAAPPDTALPLTVRVAGKNVREYVRALATRFASRPVDSRVLLRKGKPFVTEERPGRQVKFYETVAAIVRHLTATDRLPLTVPLQSIRPAVTRKNFGPVLVIRRESKWLHLYKGDKLVKRFRVATGMSQYPTPLGRFDVITKAKNPWWYPPDSDWARGEKPIPPGPGNPLGTRWMGISSPGVGIHGTPDAASLGYSLSHGCIRMAIPQAEWLFQRVEVGTTVFIIKR